MPPSLNLHSTFEQHSPSEEQYIIPHMLTHAQSCLTLCNPMDCSPPGSSVHRILQARIVEWIAIPFSRGSCLPKDRTRVSCISSIAGRFFTAEPLGKPTPNFNILSKKSLSSYFSEYLPRSHQSRKSLNRGPRGVSVE